MNFILPKIYPITDSAVSGLSSSEQVERLAAGGAKIIQLREKRSSAHDFYQSAVQAIEIARNRNIRIIINDRVDIALAASADGVHLGQDDLPAKYAREILGKNAVIGISTHSVEQFRIAMTLPVDYIAIGPIFPTKTKENPDNLVGLDGLRDVRSIVGKFPLVAIGGINHDNLASVFDAGADSAAIIGAILSDPSQIEQKIARLIHDC